MRVLGEESKGFVWILEVYPCEQITVHRVLIRAVSAVVSEVASLVLRDTGLGLLALELVFLAALLSRGQATVKKGDVIQGNPGIIRRLCVRIGKHKANIELVSLPSNHNFNLGTLALIYGVHEESDQCHKVGPTFPFNDVKLGE